MIESKRTNTAARMALLLLLAVLAAALAFSGCDQADDDDDDTADDDDNDTADDDDDDDDQQYEPYDWVDPFVGTGGQGFGQGSLMPGATMPFGMVKVSPDTSVSELVLDFAHCGGYYYGDKQIRGFSHTHLVGTGAADQGNLLLMPTRNFAGQPTGSVESYYRSNFSHDNETASPGYYSVILDRYYIKAELTATDHCGFHRYTYPDATDAQVVVNPSHAIGFDWVKAAEVTVDVANREVYGWLDNQGPMSGRYGGYILYYVVRFEQPFTHGGTFKGPVVTFGGDHEVQTDPGMENWVGAFVGFETTPTEPVLAKVGVSYISLEQARANLEAEIPDWDFNASLAEAQDRWREVLNQIEVTGGTPEQLEIFYTALYHLYMMPTLMTEGGRYVGFDKEVHDAQGFTYYSDFSLWDTYRSFHPLIDLLDEDKERDFLISMIKMYEEGGDLPKWAQGLGDAGSMIGTSSDIVFAGAYLKGIDDFDVDTAWEAMRKHGLGPTPHGRSCMTNYLAYGYSPTDLCSKGPSNSLEFCYDDYALYRMAEALGETEDAEHFFGQSRNWLNLLDKQSGFIRGKKSDGQWVEPFIPVWFGDEYCEGNAYHWSFMIPYDVDELAFQHGGREVLSSRLELMFERSRKLPDTLLPDFYYWHGNEPDILVPFMFNDLGRADLTQKWVRWVMQDKYNGEPDGIDGNDDGGTLSAWYIFSALGIFSLPGSDKYFISSPIFDSAVIHREQGDITITADNASACTYIQSVTLNGEPLDVPWFLHEDIADGGVFEFEMGPEPSGWGRW